MPLRTRIACTLIAAAFTAQAAPEPASKGTLQQREANVLRKTAPAAPQQNGRIKWRFTIAAEYTSFHPGVAADGTVYVNDVHGQTYALNPDGTLKWSVQTSFTGADGPVSVGADGTIYVMTLLLSGSVYEPAIIALNPDGTEKWHYIATGGISGRGGPNVGPDGKIYAIVRPTNTTTAHNVFALNPDGTLAWNYNEDIFRYGQLGDKDIVFGQNTDQLYFQYESSLRDNRIPQLWAFGLGGDLRWTRRASNGHTDVSPLDDSVHTGTQTFLPNGDSLWVLPLFGQGPTSNPEVGPDGVHYVQENYNTLFAVNPDGSEKWRTGNTGLLYNIAVDPGNRVLFSGGRPTYGASGFFVGYDPADGDVMFRILLPDEPAEIYGQVVPNTRPVFSPDGNTVYVGADIAGSYGPGAVSYFYAIDISPDLPCSYEISPESENVPVNGGSFAVQLGATSESCPWTAQSNDSWLTITSATSGTGNALVTYSAATNNVAEPRTGSLTIADRTFTVSQPAAGANAPQVAITYPAANASFDQPTNVFVRADASAVEGRSVSRVDFYVGNQFIGSDSSPPYQVVWNSPSTATHVLLARVFDSADGTADSQPVNITLNPPTNLFPLPISPPTLTSPTPEQVFTAPGPITLSATPAPTSYTVARVEFYVDTVRIGFATSAPYRITWDNVSPGRYAVSARTVVTTGARATSSPIDITVDPEPATLLSAVSRKFHGPAGTRDILLPLTGTPGVECRSGGVADDLQLVLTFSAPVAVTGSPQAEVTSGTAVIGNAGRRNGGQVAQNGSTITIPITDVPNGQTLTVTLHDVSDGNDVHDIVVPVTVLFGDVTGNGSVNSSDVAAVKARAGAPLDQTNFRCDLTENGVINSSDIGAVKAASGQAVVPPGAR